MVHVMADIATAISLTSLVATVALNAYLVTLAIRGSKTPARHEVGMGQLQQRRLRRMRLRLARQHRPQIDDVRADGLAGHRDIVRRRVQDHVEMRMHEGREIEAGLCGLRAVGREDVRRAR